MASVLPVLCALLRDPEVAGVADDALDDLYMYLPRIALDVASPPPEIRDAARARPSGWVCQISDSTGAECVVVIAWRADENGNVGEQYLVNQG
jgi:hypothetical protein